MGALTCQYQIDVHPDGSLARCRLANDTIVAGEVIVARTTVSFDASGKLRKLVLPPDRPRAHDGRSCGEIDLDDSGKVVGCVDAIPIDPSVEEQFGTP
jgi:hypothetical protein